MKVWHIVREGLSVPFRATVPVFTYSIRSVKPILEGSPSRRPFPMGTWRAVWCSCDTSECLINNCVHPVLNCLLLCHRICRLSFLNLRKLFSFVSFFAQVDADEFSITSFCRESSLLALMNKKQSTCLDWHLGSTLQLFVSLSLEGTVLVTTKASESTKHHLLSIYYLLLPSSLQWLVNILNLYYLMLVALTCKSGVLFWWGFCVVVFYRYISGHVIPPSPTCWL